LAGGVFEIAIRSRGDAFRAIYAVKIGADVWVIHAFQKKSKTGTNTPKIEIDVITNRLKRLKEAKGGPQMSKDDFALVRGSGNVYRDFGRPDAGLAQARAITAAKIIRILDAKNIRTLDERKLSTRRRKSSPAFPIRKFARIRNAQLRRFTLDRMIMILGKLDEEVEVSVIFKPRRAATAAPRVA
jgi:hypothetical protein